MDMSQTSSVHQTRSSLRSSEVVAGNFGELRLLQDISDRKESQKLQQACVLHNDSFGPVCQEDRYDDEDEDEDDRSGSVQRTSLLMFEARGENKRVMCGCVNTFHVGLVWRFRDYPSVCAVT